MEYILCTIIGLTGALTALVAWLEYRIDRLSERDRG
jgi:hypothetical protein